MIVVDTSAVVAILLREPDAELFAAAIETAGRPLMSAATLVELNAVMRHRRGPDGMAMVERFVALAGIEIVSFSQEQAMIASAAYDRYSVLNFGDCFAYALAKERDLPLLYKGDDFGRTDIAAAMCLRLPKTPSSSAGK